jgi:hypothetical protein
MAVVSPRSQPPARLRLSSPADVLAAVPYLIGFTPRRSVVVLCLRGKQLGLTMRLDLDMAPDELRAIVLSRVRGDDASAAIVVVFDPDAATGGRRPGSAIARPLIQALRRAGFQVQDALGVREGLFWSYLCTQLSCCPSGGRPIPAAGGADHSRVAAPFVAIGAAPLGSREELSASVATLSGERRARLAACFDAALESPSANPIDRWWTAVRRYTTGPPRPGGTLSTEEAARLIVALRDVAVRDEVVSWTAGDAITGVLAVLRELAPLALPPFDTQLLATLAWAAYSLGDGALAAVALERALAAEPGHSLARLLMLALETGVTPSQLRAIGLELSSAFSAAGDPSLPRSPDGS